MTSVTETLADVGGDEEDSSNQPDDRPACYSCRKKKAKCSREQPCSLCARAETECVYDDFRGRPGLKLGALEAMGRRLDDLEKMFLGQNMLLEGLLRSGIRRSELSGEEQPTQPLSARTSRIRRLLHDAYEEGPDPKAQKRDEECTAPESRSRRDPPTFCCYSDDLSTLLPNLEFVQAVVDAYFVNVHPWIPVVNEEIFREKFSRSSLAHSKLTIILLAMCVTCMRYVSGSDEDDARLPKSWETRCKKSVMLAGMQQFSVENLQALIILTFDSIGSGHGPSTWSAIGSMARNVEQLQLSVEKSESSSRIIRRMAFLDPPESWVEEEERRRVFWAIFLMDRFCSVATGWNPSLTTADVHRRLPCEGALWAKGVPVVTPFFGITDQSSLVGTGNTQPLSIGRENDVVNRQNIGGFAYCVEAMESLNLVTQFFLNTDVQSATQNELRGWIVRFKELDLRLLRWKDSLPERWKNPAFPSQNGFMDPNLTLAHLTHNTAVIQLHQHIGYQCAAVALFLDTLPPAPSAHYCFQAAAEICSISRCYIETSIGIINPQFSYCLFIAGRSLLAHAAKGYAPLSTDVDSAICSLEMIADRWNGPHRRSGPGPSPENLASKFAARLKRTRNAFEANDSDRDAETPVDIQESAYSTKEGYKRDQSAPRLTSRRLNDQSFYGMALDESSDLTHVSNPFTPDSITMAYPPLPVAFTQILETSQAGPLVHGAQLMNGASTQSAVNGMNLSWAGNGAPS